MTQEEKAKAYDEAIKIAKSKIKNNKDHVLYEDDIIEIFPELKESEDEKVRKTLIHIVKCACDKYGVKYQGKEISEDKLLAWLEKQGEQKPAGKVEPKFRIKYAGSEYNVLEVKDIAGVTYYGIEDEPNHIDYVQAENCEKVGGYSIKEKGSPYPTKPAKFSEQKTAWSEEDDDNIMMIEDRLSDYLDYISEDSTLTKHQKNSLKEKVIGYVNWLKSLKERMKGE